MSVFSGLFWHEHVPVVKKCKAIDGKREKAVKVRFCEKLLKAKLKQTAHLVDH